MNISYINADELIFNNNPDEKINSGGFSVDSIMMKYGLSPIKTLNNMNQNGDSETVSGLFDNLVIPNWSLSYNNNKGYNGGDNRGYNGGDKKYIDSDYESDYEFNSENNSDCDEIIDDDLHDKLLNLVKYDNSKKKSKKNNKKNNNKKKL